MLVAAQREVPSDTEPIPGATHRDDVPRRLRIVAKPFAQRREMRFHGPTLGAGSIPPHLAEKVGA